MKKHGKKHKSPIVAIDFDGTIVAHRYPKIGEPVPYALETMRAMLAENYKLILYTMRSGEYLQEAIDYLAAEGIEFWAINENPTQRFWTDSPKVYAHIYIDDAALGCPLIEVENDRPIVDWLEIARHFELIEYLSETKQAASES
jgi:hydroxymethylpyrimidine pyrophosphatase-like HAD family hydrolase